MHFPKRAIRSAAVAMLGSLVATACGDEPVRLGPIDGFDLPPTDLDRVSVGTVAPDFTLRSFSGETVTLSDYRGQKNVVLVFYRGHW